MKASVRDRIDHIKTAIRNIRHILNGRQSAVLDEDVVLRAAYERFLEIISEASRHVPAEDQARHPQIPWRNIADIGNHIRHGYDGVDSGILWAIYENDLDAFERAIDEIRSRYI